MKNNFNFAFFGTPDVASRTLDILLESGYVPKIIVTSPDKQSGRGLELTSSMVSKWADEHHIPCLKPEKIDEVFIDQFKKLHLALYKNSAGGLPAAEQGIESSAWYVFNAIGIYPLNLADGNFYLTTPLFSKTIVSANNKTKFIVSLINNSLPDQYISSAILNNQYLKLMYIASGSLNNGAIIKLDNQLISNSSVPSLSHDKGKLIRKIHKKGKNKAVSP